MVSAVGLDDKIILKYETGRPGGWVHDFALFSDVSVWVEKRQAGYYGFFPVALLVDLEKWCKINLEYKWSIRHNEIFISNKNDAAIFSLRWS